MAVTKYIHRSIPRVSLHDFENRIDEITAQLIHAAETDGFFTIVNSSIGADEVDEMFDNSARFFALPDDIKATVPFSHKNTGWEKAKQIRPSTGVADQKESYQIQYGDNMEGMWLDEAQIPDFRSQCLAFMRKAHDVSIKLMVCFSRGLGFPDDFFAKAHDITRPNCQTVLRLLHYFEVDRSSPIPENYSRAGAHADWDFITLLFQRTGQSGLEICPGREVFTAFGAGDTWTKVEPTREEIVCNIGDALMSWSDDRFKSTFHRVKTPSDPNDYYGPRFSMAYFNQPCTDVKIQGPLKKYPEVTAAEFTQLAMNRNFAALRAKQAALEAEKGFASGPPVAAASA